VGARSFGDVGNSVFDLLGLVGRYVQQDVGVSGRPAVRECLVDRLHVDGIGRLDLESGDFEIFAGHVGEGADLDADDVRA
jgi:hypothetical protein